MNSTAVSCQSHWHMPSVGPHAHPRKLGAPYLATLIKSTRWAVIEWIELPQPLSVSRASLGYGNLKCPFDGGQLSIIRNCRNFSLLQKSLPVVSTHRKKSIQDLPLSLSLQLFLFLSLITMCQDPASTGLYVPG